MKLAQMVDPKFQESLQKLLKQPLQAKVAFKLRGTVKKIQEEVDKYDVVRQELLKRHGKKDENGELFTEGGNVQFSQEGMQEFIKEFSELTNLDIAVDTVSIDSLGEAVSLTTEDMLALDGLIV